MINIRDNLTLKACRIVANIDAKELADAIGVNVDTLYKWESSKSYPNAIQMSKIANYFEKKGYFVDMNYLNFF